MHRFHVITLMVVLGFAAPAVFAEETAAPAATEAAEGLPDLENLDFASGEIVSFDTGNGKLDVKVYLDSAGEANEQVLALVVDNETEITDGENELKTDALAKGSEVDVEYDTRSKKATYIFIY